MNKTAMSCGLAVFILYISNTEASDFDGFYIGANAGSNRSTATSLPDKKSNYAEVEAGHNWDFQNFLLGVNAFFDTHHLSYTGKDAGMDLKLSLPIEAWLPYIKVGLTDSDPGVRAHGGLGAEYKFAPQWSINGEWTVDSITFRKKNYKNSSILIGINYYFGENSSTVAAREAEAKEAAAKATRGSAAGYATARENWMKWPIRPTNSRISNWM